ncbi:hypothetical protein Agub_g7789 [Astrephomene gubernaculifera]|uniref:Secreted protein n=1 Tax=Astrephomene gubernaculifera TaxID=47775 RepID=A0AAD3DQY7_9CHLO|nr:hypothetical protein Agub_g7789 [Astrephomene gubernaculifera]
MYPTAKIVATALLCLFVATDAATKKAPPPPSPVHASDVLRLIGDINGAVEPNLCSNRTDFDCARSARAEVLVYGPKAKQSYWAPLCEPADAGTKHSLADLICKLMTGLPRLDDSTTTITMRYQPNTSIGSYIIPKGNPKNATYFKPNSYNRWVTVTGGNFSTASSVQDLKLKVSATKCADGKMLAMRCEIYFVDRWCIKDGVRVFC